MLVEVSELKTLILVLGVLLIAFTAVMIAIARIETQESRREEDEADSGAGEETETRDEG